MGVLAGAVVPANREVVHGEVLSGDRGAIATLIDTCCTATVRERCHVA